MKLYEGKIPKKPGYYYGGYIVNGKAYPCMCQVILSADGTLMTEGKPVSDLCYCYAWSSRIPDATWDDK